MISPTDGGRARDSAGIAQLSAQCDPKIPTFCPAVDTPRVSLAIGDWQKWGDCHMKIKASGRAASILATGFLVCFAAPSLAPAATDGAGAKSARHYRHHVHHRSGKVVAKSFDSQKDDAPEAADNNAAAPIVLPPTVANANALFAAADNTLADSARAMTTRANDNVQAAADARAQPANEGQVVAPDQLNDVDRALREETPPAQTTFAMAAAEAPAAPAPQVTAASSESSTWDQTSLIGKIFIGFGALLTLASAARMFMA
jgi:hypothetical protein